MAKVLTQPQTRGQQGPEKQNRLLKAKYVTINKHSFFTYKGLFEELLVYCDVYMFIYKGLNHCIQSKWKDQVFISVEGYYHVSTCRLICCYKHVSFKTRNVFNRQGILCSLYFI